MNKLLPVVAAMLASAVVPAQAIVVPAAAANTQVGTTTFVWRDGVCHVQCFYDSTNFLTQGLAQPVTIAGIQFRLGNAQVTNLVTYPDVEIYLQNSAVNFLTPNTTFSVNRTVALPTTPNFAGPVTTQPVGGGSPNDYFITIPLTVPFVYDPTSNQDLLMEIFVNQDPSPLLGNQISSGSNIGSHLCNSIRNTTSTTALTGSPSAFPPVARFLYSPVPGFAANHSLGAGCYTKARSFYEVFAAMTNDLSGQTVSMAQNANGGYDVTTAAGGAVVAPTGTGLALGDDEVSLAIALPFTFDYPGGSTNTIYVDSNGSILLGASGGSVNTATAAALLDSVAPRLCPAMMDLEPDGVTNIANVFAEPDPGTPGTFLITWNGVPCFGASTPSTFQIVLIDNGIDDVVLFRYQTLVNDSTISAGRCLTGFSLGNGALDGGGSDLTTTVISTQADVPPLTLDALSRPVTNTSWDLEVTNIPPTALIGVDLFGLVDPGVDDLAFIGMPGCGLRSSLELQLPYVPAGASHGYGLALPDDPGLVGTIFYTTSVMFTNPPENAFGAITANGIQGDLGTF